MHISFPRRAALLLIALVLAGCGVAAPGAPASAPAPTVAPAATSVPTETPAPTVAPTAAPAPTEAPVVAFEPIVDSAGREVLLDGAPASFISLAPSTTEILFALGLGEQVLAVDDFSNYPEDATNLPKIGGFDLSYNYEQITVLQPDLVLAAGITAPDAIDKIESLGIPVAVIGTPQTTLDGVLADIELVGALTGRETSAAEITAAMRAQLEQVKTTLSAVSTRPRVFWELDATDPSKPYTIGPGNFVNDLLTLAGGDNIFATVDSPFPQVSAEQIVAADPEVILLADAQYGVSVESVLARPGWDPIAAVRNQRVYPIDADLASRPGPRVVEAIETIARLLHPELFEP